MRDLERLLAPDCHDNPVCRCGNEMTRLRSIPRSHADIMVFSCAGCGHELHLATWRNDIPLPAANSL
jgi:hypothetical protein